MTARPIVLPGSYVGWGDPPPLPQSTPFAGMAVRGEMLLGGGADAEEADVVGSGDAGAVFENKVYGGGA